MAQEGVPTISQSEPLFKNIHGEQDQIPNNAGGYVFKVDDLKRALRFIIMGAESGCYYAIQEKLERENVKCIDRLIANGRGVEVVQLIKDVSVKRRNVRQGPLLLAYAICARSNDKDTKKAAYALISEICRIPTDLFNFVKDCEDESKDTGTGWGRAHKRAVCQWYSNFQNDVMKLAYLITKYKQRVCWSHKDLLRLCHLSADNGSLGFLLRYIVKGLKPAQDYYLSNHVHNGEEVKRKIRELNNFLEACEAASVCNNADQLCSLIDEHKLSWEHCNSKHLKNPKVWKALLPQMGVWAMVRNLGRMTSYGMFAVNSEEEQIVLNKIRTINQVVEAPAEGDDGDGIEHMEVDDDDDAPEPNVTSGDRRRNMLHPFKILIGLKTYESASGEKGHLSWTPNKYIVEALNEAFYQAFEAVRPTGKKFYLAVDVSGSMSQPALGNSNIYCSTAAACMMMVTARTEDNCIIKGFSSCMQNIEITSSDTLKTVEQKMEQMTFGSTDCAQPMIDAMDSKIRDVDVFVVYTDNETWFGKIHPCEALKQYRQWSDRKDAKLIVCGMCASEFSIADKEDPGMLDIAGFDSASPRLISEFAMGNI